MKTLPKIVLFITIPLFASCTPVSCKAPISERLDEINIELLLKEQIKKQSIPAIAVGIVDTDTIIIYSHGVKSINNPIPIEINDKFDIGSCSKSFTSFLAARLIKKGPIKYETTIKEIFASTNTIHPYYHDKTLADLLSHRAGIQPFTKEEEFQRIPGVLLKKDRANNRQLFSEWVLTLEPTRDSQHSYIYSNAGYSIAATMLEKISNKSWETLMFEEVFKPLGINGWYGFPHLHSTNQPRGHINLAEYDSSAEDTLIQFPDSSEYDIYLFEPGGGITLSIAEHAVFLQELLKGLKGQGTLLTNEEYSDLLHSDYLYSKGWLQLKTNGIYYLAHEGSNGMFYARAILCKQLNYGLILLSNAGNKETINGLQNITNTIDFELRKSSR
jgi:CubicO group peptidase (beta-lactamase class C family)